jgi:dehydrogenase/reductase SDR family protein 12
MSFNLLDYSPYHSFDKRGFERHKKFFSPLPHIPENKTAFVTGGTSGIGLGVTQFLKKSNCKILITGRDQKKAIPLENEKTHFIKLDLTNWNEILKIVDHLENSIDYLVLNAGGMPEQLTKNSFEYEYQCASQLLGHFILFRNLHDKKKLSPKAKIIFVSSGGMYLKRLDLSELFDPKKYDKVSCYANVKRAQVILTDLMARNPEYSSYFVSSMHPGWVDTEAVKEALPEFYKITKNNLRNIQEGSDTINYLLATENLPSGQFWFDRSIKNPNPPLLLWTKSSEQEKAILIERLEATYQKLIHQDEVL